MCGRYSLTKTGKKKLAKRFKVRKMSRDLKPRYNIAPSQKIAVISNKSPEEITHMRWGLVPHWTKEIDARYSMINARAESILKKPSYKGPIRNNRCLVIGDSFYEWKSTPSGKVPYRIELEDGSLFSFAGIWDKWTSDGEKVYSCAIITTSPNALMGEIHQRMPVILPEDGEHAYLDSNTSLENVIGLLRPFEGSMRAHEVSRLVNSPQNDQEEVTRPA
ncbi:MAG: hypothetical protein GF409_01530 [Candidatus Omnitrophica bacterium]|nr:hypothetical protein [Candidatus Omnitrophota bacterium]